MSWRIELLETDEQVPIITVLTAHRIWARLSKSAQEAVEAAYPDRTVRAHLNTLASLERHGFTESPYPGRYPFPCGAPVLTEAGKAVARWCVKP